LSRILFITVDEQRFDALGCTGGKVAKTPRLDGLAYEGIVYERAYVTNPTCMPSRASIMTGQHPATHGLTTNGISLPLEAPSFAEHLKDSGYRTALIGKAHLQPVMGEPERYWEVGAAGRGNTGPYRGFEHVLVSSHGKGVARNHYQVWMEKNAPEEFKCYLSQTTDDGKMNASGGGDTGAIQVHENKISKENYHTYWLADRSNEWIDERSEDEDWFLWLSFGDPHHPYQPPSSELGRVNWRDLDLPDAHQGTPEAVREQLATKPGHWSDFYEGVAHPATEIPMDFIPKDMTNDQVREINARIHIMNELVDEAIGNVLDKLAERGWLEDTHIIFTSDHGSMQGDYGMMFKGPFHVDSLIRIPLIWRPASGFDFDKGRTSQPVSLLDLAPSFCKAAGVSSGDWMQGDVLPLHQNAERDFVICEWDQDCRGVHIQISSIVSEDYICSRYARTNRYPSGDGELYSYADDPHQQNNLWDDPTYRTVRDTLLKKLDENLPPRRAEKLERRFGA
ncbi:MAG: sulfatase-like hydrolase/transferase, partial [Epibacterium sp.]|nr:sulfatase-like hydrolase/transferase [Epibacterium sp.]NQX75572.1 sulfatase-like hydrolase/transferase [Epibacterium sp.]